MTSASPARKGIPRWAWVVVGLALASVILCTAVGAFVAWQLQDFDPLSSTQIDNLSPERVERAAAIKLPPSARNLHSHYESFMDYFIHVRFEMDATDLPVFLANTHVQQPLSPSEVPNDIQNELNQPWWKPQAATSFQAGSGSVSVPSGSPQYQSILIDTSDPQTYIVYVTAFDT